MPHSQSIECDAMRWRDMSKYIARISSARAFSSRKVLKVYLYTYMKYACESCREASKSHRRHSHINGRGGEKILNWIESALRMSQFRSYMNTFHFLPFFVILSASTPFVSFTSSVHEAVHFDSARFLNAFTRRVCDCRMHLNCLICSFLYVKCVCMPATIDYVCMCVYHSRINMAWNNWVNCLCERIPHKHRWPNNEFYIPANH